MTYNAYDKGILPEPGGLGSQPLKFMPMMALLRSRTQAEMDDEQKRREADGSPGKKSLTEDYLERRDAHDDHGLIDPLDAAAVGKASTGRFSPDGIAAVPGLVKPRAGIGRR